MPPPSTTTRTRTSGFSGTILVADDIHSITVDATGGGPEQVRIEFTLPSFYSLPAIYITPGRARELRDRLTAALDTLPVMA